MAMTFALAGNPNCGKTTLFNNLTGSSQYVGNWPGVTVEKKEGKLKGNKQVSIMDLPGIYSLSPYTLEEVVSRDYLLNESPDVIINLVDASNLERNLYLTTQILEIGIPVVVALNMMDIVKNNGDQINVEALSKNLGCPVVEITAVKGQGSKELIEAATAAAQKGGYTSELKYSEEVQGILDGIAEQCKGQVPDAQLNWYTVKLFERDEKVLEKLDLPENVQEKIEGLTAQYEEKMDDDSESIITNERYNYITSMIDGCMKKNKVAMTTSDKIDRVVTNRILALPIFVVIMFLVYFLTVQTVGTFATDWANDGLFGDGWHLFGIGASKYEDAAGEYEDAVAEIEENVIASMPDEKPTVVQEAIDAEIEKSAPEEPDPAEYGVWVPGIPVLVESGLEAVNASDIVSSLVLDGIVGGVGAVLGFLPQMLVMFLLLAILEDCGYMARVAFVMDRIFRRFGLSGKTFIPLMVAMGCGVPGVMASRTIENEKDRKMTIMVTTFIPCGAKLPVIALIAGALFDNNALVSASIYFIGIAMVIFSGVVLKKTKAFASEPAPFVMELPQYHVPGVKGLLIHMWDRGKSFVAKAGTIIFISSAIIWFLSTFSFGMKVVEQDQSMLAGIGKAIAPVFAPLGFNNWKAAVATITGLVAKENVVGTMGVLESLPDASEESSLLLNSIAGLFTSVSAMSFLIFNMICAPCFAAIGAIKREMGTWKWTLIAIGYQTLLAYCLAFVVYQFGAWLVLGSGFGIGTALAFAVVALAVYLLFRRGYTGEGTLKKAAAQV